MALMTTSGVDAFFFRQRLDRLHAADWTYCLLSPKLHFQARPRHDRRAECAGACLASSPSRSRRSSSPPSRPSKCVWPSTGSRHDDLREPSREPPVIGRRAKRPIESRRRNLERVAVVDRFLDVQNRAHVPADALAVLDARRRAGRLRPAPRRRRMRRVGVERHVDKNPQHPPRRLAAELDVENFQVVRTGDPLGDGANSVNELRNHPQKQKVGTGPLQVLQAERTNKFITQQACTSRS